MDKHKVTAAQADEINGGVVYDRENDCYSSADGSPRDLVAEGDEFPAIKTGHGAWVFADGHMFFVERDEDDEDDEDEGPEQTPMRETEQPRDETPETADGGNANEQSPEHPPTNDPSNR